MRQCTPPKTKVPTSAIFKGEPRWRLVDALALPGPSRRGGRAAASVLLGAPAVLGTSQAGDAAELVDRQTMRLLALVESLRA
jgi:hypothetical protein